MITRYATTVTHGEGRMEEMGRRNVDTMACQKMANEKERRGGAEGDCGRKRCGRRLINTRI